MLFNVGNVRRYLIVSFIIILVPLTLIYLSNIYQFRIINETIEFSGINQNKILQLQNKFSKEINKNLKFEDIQRNKDYRHFQNPQTS